MIIGPKAQRFTDEYGEWVKLLRHDSSNSEYFSSLNDWEEAKQTNTSYPNGTKYSILSEWGRFLRDGKYTLKLDYPNNNFTNIWSQTSNPVENPGMGVTGYVAISIQGTSNGWGGLESYGSNTFLDGTVNSGNWYYAVGAKSAWGGADSFPGPSFATKLVELWILNKAI